LPANSTIFVIPDLIRNPGFFLDPRFRGDDGKEGGFPETPGLISIIISTLAPLLSSPLRGEDQGEGDLTTEFSPSPFSPPTGGGDRYHYDRPS
jgi:hypothetical protein